MITLPQITNLNGVPLWRQSSDSDLTADFWASFNVDVSENEGRVRAGRRIILNTSTVDVAEITAPPCSFTLCGTSVYAFAGASNTGYAFKNDGTMIGTFAKDTSVGLVGVGTFSGSGLNDAAYSGGDTSLAEHTYTVIIDATGTPDTFKWKVDSGSFTTGVPIVGGPIALANGVSITFGATTGHTMSAQWVVSTTATPAKIDSTTSDSVFSNNAMYVSCQDVSSSGFVAVHKKIGNQGWTKISTGATFDSTMPNMMCSYIGKTYVTYQQSKVFTLNSSDAITLSALTINVSGDFTNVITKLLPADDRIFILCVNTTGGKGHVYEWDGLATAATFDHRLESSGALAGVMFNGVPYIIDTNANLLAWNGGTFIKVAGLYRKNNLPLYNPVSLVNNRFVHPNGMSVVNNRIHILINNQNYDNAGSIEETIPSGIYEYDPAFSQRGLIHKESIAANKAADTITQYGQVRLSGVGALKEMGIQSTASGANGVVMIGAGYFSDATTAKYGIFYDDRNDTLQKTGYFITCKIQAQGGKGVASVDNIWNSVYPCYRQLLSASSRIVVKYRVTDVAPIEATITWTSATTFTTTTDVSAYANYEVEVLQGIGAGKSAKITSVVNNAGTYTVTVATAYTSATSGTGKARFQYWIEKGTVSDQLYTSQKIGVHVSASWIQFKVTFLFTGKDEIERLVITNSINKTAE